MGAHQAHLVAGRLRGPIACDECHVVPAGMAEHEAEIARIAAGAASRVTFGPLADRGAGTAAWDPATATCSAIYCHGANLNHGGSLQVPTWTLVDAGHSQAACGTCHGFPPVNPGHPVLTLTFPLAADPCAGCHSQTTTGTLDAATGYPRIDVAGGRHVDGALTIDGGGGCDTCHGFPPADAAHLAHTDAAVAAYGDLRLADDVFAADSARYAFGCGHCHPLDFAQHDRHFSESAGVFVTLTPDAGTEGSLRALASAAAAYDPADTTCSGVYCHSTGQELPEFVARPGWSSGDTLGCDGCHANPPGYATGGAGAATANSHVGWLLDGGYVLATGHFGGLPAALHEGSAHGSGIGEQFSGDAASPITCQTCHFVTANPSHTGPSAFYYLDTTGRYRPADDWTGAATPVVLACASCHTGTPPAGAGGTRPYFHVNGARDVVFDPRTDLAGMDAAWAASSLPAAPNTPRRPYWYTRATTNNISGTPAPAVAGIVGRTDAGFDGTTLSLHLANATWDPATKTCGSVACHFNAANRPPIRWGEPLVYTGAPDGTCGICHDN